MRTETPTRIHLKDYRPPAWLVDTIDLDIRLYPKKTLVKAVLAVRRNPAAGKGPAPLVLDGERQHLLSVSVDGKPLAEDSYTLDEQQLTVTDVPGDAFTVAIETRCNPSANTELSGLYLSNGTYCTQCEAEGFRRITFFPDRPDVLAVYTVRVEADEEAAPVLLSNGNPGKSGTLEGGRHFAVWHDPFPKPSYLFALVAGRLARVSDTFRTASRRKVALNIYVEHGMEDRAGYAMDALKRAMRWDEKRFGREYDLKVFNIVAVADFNMGAMENKGLNIFNDKFILASPETATDLDYANIEAIVAHEYFHNWTGNRITCRDWFQLCLKEGLTVFRDQEFSADMRDAAVERIQNVKILRARQFTEDAGPLAHPVRPESFIEINNFYTSTVYEKGAELVRMVRTIVGDTGFRAGIDLYFERHDGDAATVEDFLRCFEDATGADLKQFRLWYSQAGTPELVIGTKHDARKRTFTVDVEQVLAPTPNQPTKKAMHIPLAVALFGADGEELPLTTQDGAVSDGVVHVRKRRETVRFVDVDVRPVPSVLRTFSAPVRLTTNASDKDLLFLLAHDTDPFTRWQSAQDYATRRLLAAYRSRTKGARPEAGALAEALERVIVDDTLDPAFRALMLELPTGKDITMAVGHDVNPDRVHEVREALREALAWHLAPALTALHDGLTPPSPYSPDARSAAMRSLRNAAMALLAAPGDDAAARLAAARYRAADNMTDMMAALGTLTHIDHKLRETLLATFLRRFRRDPLVVDKWFTLQAVSTAPEAPERIAALMEHRLFTLKNPNRVRSLLGAFATLNLTGFHDASGDGYRLVADAVRTLDAINPQVAARLLGSFSNWKMMEQRRRAKARSVLSELARDTGLSADVSEIAQTAVA